MTTTRPRPIIARPKNLAHSRATVRLLQALARARAALDELRALGEDGCHPGTFDGIDLAELWAEVLPGISWSLSQAELVLDSIFIWDED